MTYQELINSILYTVLTIISPLVVAYVINFLKAKIDETKTIEKATQSEVISKYIKDALNNIADAVVYVNQTYVDSLKKAGKFDEVAQKEAYDKAYAKALELISDEIKDTIVDIYGSFDTWVNLKIEAAVNAEKKAGDRE